MIQNNLLEPGDSPLSDEERIAILIGDSPDGCLYCRLSELDEDFEL